MSILLNKDTKVMVQGITGKTGRVQTAWMLEYGTNIVAGCTPGKGGQEVEGVPVYNTVAECVQEQGAEASLFFIPPVAFKQAAYETIDAGINLLIVVTEHLPVHDVMEIKEYARDKDVTLIGPTTPGVITVGESKMGIMPGNMFNPGRIGIISRSGTLSYETSINLAAAGYGQSTVVGIGADPVVFTNLPDLLGMFEADPDTDVVVIVGEVGGIQEEMAAEYIDRWMTKPVIAYIAGLNTPEGKKMGHAGAIIRSDGKGTPQSKIAALREVGVDIAKYPADIVTLVKNHLG
ncbi:MAG: succinate--CoA ligase subunit alpha [Chloroflexi bacterium]|jgi:succinyl-CoA synthetase alpha subunit|nr:succinate--CoA ligase subunit alpha [Chloroflexota bacterium]MBT7082515.1 succinate--CoA ligase subunit alpha [Chloroflexota bacterium]MBT7289216.1 succinate--CoA ligase subunit alpha [Chloroflexota bacterium]